MTFNQFLRTQKKHKPESAILHATGFHQAKKASPTAVKDLAQLSVILILWAPVTLQLKQAGAHGTSGRNWKPKAQTMDKP
jgi:hypothetical protein